MVPKGILLRASAVVILGAAALFTTPPKAAAAAMIPLTCPSRGWCTSDCPDDPDAFCSAYSCPQYGTCGASEDCPTGEYHISCSATKQT